MKWKTNAIAALATMLSLSLTPWAGAAEHTPEIVWLPEGVSISKEPYQKPGLIHRSGFCSVQFCSVWIGIGRKKASHRESLGGLLQM